MIRYVEDKKGPPVSKGLLDEIRKWRKNANVNDDLTLLEIWRDDV